MMLLINQGLFSSEMRKYASFAEMNMILMTITKATLFRGGFRLGGGGVAEGARPPFFAVTLKNC